MISKVARRYASAYLQTVLQLSKLKQAKEDMLFIEATTSGSKDLQLFLKSPIVKSDDKKEALETIFESHVTKESFSLINLLVHKGREGLLNEISREFLNLYNLHEGIVEVDVTTASTLSEDQKKELLKSLENKTGKTIKMNLSVDESIRGGVIIKIDDTVIDGSVKHKISQLKNQFAVSTAE